MNIRSLMFCAAVLASGPAFAAGAATAAAGAPVMHTPASTSAAPAIHASTTPAAAHPSLYARAQTKLKTDGLYNGPINGQRDTVTIAAIRQFQTQHHLAVNGRLNAATKRALGV